METAAPGRATSRTAVRLRVEGLFRATGAAVFATIAAYCLVSFVAGTTGVVSCIHLERRIALMVANIDRLGRYNARLAADLESLAGDPERLVLEARKLGYLRRNETEIFMVGRSPGDSGFRAGDSGPGSIVRAGARFGLSDRTIKRVSVIIGAVALLAMLYRLVRRGRGQERPPADPRSTAESSAAIS